MPTYEFFGYKASALVYNPISGAFTLKADYDFTADRFKMTISDDDSSLDGDANYDMVGDDANQTGTITAPDGSPIASGKIYDKAYAEVLLPGGGVAWLERIEVNGVHIGYLASQQLPPGTALPVTYSENITSFNTVQYSQLFSAPCFGAQVRLTTADGAQPIGEIKPGDWVKTQDNGYEPVHWVGRSTASLRQMQAQPELRPVVIPRGAIGQGQPRRDVICSQDHRFVIQSAQAELYFDETTVFVSAKALAAAGVGYQHVPATPVTYVHVLLSSHQVILAEGIWSESLLAGPETMRRVGMVNRMLLANQLQMPILKRQAALPCLSAREATLLFPPVATSTSAQPLFA